MDGESPISKSSGEWSLDKLLKLLIDMFILLRMDEKKKYRISGYLFAWDGQ
jgi:hypothetical protein